ncbi:MAG: VOC family protein [Syntrophobacterales bacterium]|nr:VOC family protein [Syntrophobacterales bacterium]
MLEHIGITINEESDIQAFYKDLLGLKEVNKFDLYKELSEKLFGISNEVSVTHLSGDDLFVELFLTNRKQNPVYNHICISVLNRDSLVKKAESGGFPVTQIKRESRDDLLFIRDNSGNIFEIKSR